MEVKEKSKKRELIKTIAIVFLAVLLVLTFFSGTIMNYSLPEVATQMVSSGTINAKIRGSGTLAANESYEVNLKQTREVRSVCVKVGDTVEEGTLLFVLGDVESEELRTAQEALENARISYQRKVLELSKSYSDNDLTVKSLREDLERAIAQRDANQVTDEEVTFAKGDLAAAKTALTQTQAVLKELNAVQTDSEEYANAKAKVTELETEIKALTTAVEGYEEQLEKLDNGEDVTADRAVEDAKKALDRAQTTWEGDWLAYKAIIIKLMREAKEDDSWSFSGDTYKFDSADQIAIEGYLKKAEIESSKKTEDSSDESTGTLPSELSKQREAYNTLLKDQNDIDAKKQAYDRARDDQSDASSNASQQRRNIRDKLDEAESDLAAAERQLRTAQQELDAASGANAQLKEQIRAWEATQRQQEASITTLEANLAALQEKQTAYKAALETVNAKQRELETTLSGKDIDKQLNNLELQSMNIEIEKQQELVDKYTKDSVGAEIKSPVSGVVSAINVSAGKDTTPDQAMAVIDVVDRGYILKIPVTNEQAKQVKVGDTAEVTNYYWGNEITAVLESITSDPSSAGQKKLLVFRVSGDIEAGTNITLSVGQRSAPMDAIVPKSAVREDANGKFVLVVTSRSTPLGNRYTATRADIQVLAEDDTSVAVSGLASSDYVITTSSKPLDAGSQVRMVENPS
ncbi:MAG: HlyD family efflux transporter periplasmic adaptor subunit [Oscillospiraceae bacterium]|jgi:multidrug efflux pump subunit AcrA (membrane-fusion protein)|nr:HlyD family efflux transporter periplasmic adaptor subunit [Oscillospiraceae bacterium]